VNNVLKWARPGVVISCAALSSCVAAGERADTAEAFVGVAEMKADGTIILQLGSTSFEGAVNEGPFEYPPTHPDYTKILNHIRPITPGRRVRVRPFTSEMNQQRESASPKSLSTDA
jgi:hypothetical protein